MTPRAEERITLRRFIASQFLTLGRRFMPAGNDLAQAEKLNSAADDQATRSRPEISSALTGAASTTETRRAARAESALNGRGTRGIAGRRATVDAPDDLWANTLSTISMLSADDYWRGHRLDSLTLDKISPAKLLELMVDVSPEVSSALFYYLTMFNSGYEVEARKPGTETVDPKATKALSEVMRTLTQLHGSPKIVFDRMAISLWMRGSVFAEAVLDANARDFIDLATPDPQTLTFRKARDEVRGTYWQYGQNQGGQFVRLDDMPTVRYMPFHPLPGKIQGRSPANSSLFVCLFLIVMLHDLRRVIQQQGYPRTDIAVDLEKLRDLMPENLANVDDFKSWADELVDAVKTVVDALEPDDTYIHSDVVTVNDPKGAMSTASLGIIGELFKALERMATRALKTTPLLQATTDGVSEANANRQWEIYSKSIKSMQQCVESVLQSLFEVILQAQGIIADVVFRFAELRAAEEFRDAQTLLLKTTIARALYDSGYISQDEAAMMAVNKKKADQTEPRKVAAAPPPAPGDPSQTNPEPGANRDAMALLRLWAARIAGSTTRAPTSAELENSLEFWKRFAPEIAEKLPAAQPAA